MAVQVSAPHVRSASGPSARTRWSFEIQFARDGDNPGLDKYHVHIRCSVAWEFEGKTAQG